MHAEEVRFISTQPSKVESYLLSKVLPDVVQRLILVPFIPAGPIAVKNLSLIQLVGINSMLRKVKGSLRKNEMQGG